MYLCNYVKGSNRAGINSTLSIGGGDAGRYLNVESVTADWREIECPNHKIYLWVLALNCGFVVGFL